MDKQTLRDWLVRNAPVFTEYLGAQRRLFGRRSDEMVSLHGHYGEAIVVKRTQYDAAINHVVKQLRKHEARQATARARKRKRKHQQASIAI